MARPGDPGQQSIARAILRRAVALAVIFLVVVATLLVPSSAFALDPGKRFRDFVIDNWTIEQGLPQVSVLSIAQDTRGYMWVGTQNSIARFDGVRFEVYDRVATGGIDTTMASVAHRDSMGRIWFGTPRGALRLQGERFTLLREGSNATPVTDIVETAQGNVLLATPRGVMRAAENGLEPHLLGGEATYALLSEGETLWIGQTGAIVRSDARGTTRIELPADAAKARVTHLASTAAGVWLGTTHGVYRVEGDRVVDGGLDKDLASISVECLYADSGGNLWIGTAPTLYRLSPVRGLEKLGGEDFVRNSWIESAFEDREGNLWLGSQSESLFRLWNGWATRVTDRDGLPDAFIWGVARSREGQIVFGSNSDVAVLVNDGARELIAGSALPNPAAYEVYFDRSDRLWVGTRAGLALFDRGKNVTPPAFAALAPYQINVVLQADEDEYWVGSHGGLYRWRGGELERVGAAPGSPEARVRSIYLLGPQHLLVGTEAGVREVQGASVSTPAWAKPLEGSFVSAIAPISPGVLGFTTLDAGLGLKRGDHFKLLTTDDGLPTNNAWALAVVQGLLYVPTIEGVWRVPLGALPDPQDARRAHIEPELVLSPRGQQRGSARARCCNGGASSRLLVDGDGIWVASISGALRLDIHDIAPSGLPPTAVVEAMRIGTQWHKPGQEIALGGASRDVEIRFTGLSFRDPRGVRFRYKLDGYDQDWQDAGTRRSAFYTNLPPGEYRFQLRAATSSGLESAVDSALAFRVEPRLYERLPVRVAALFALIGLVALIVRARLHAYRARQRDLEAVVAQRTLELKDANLQLAAANLALAEESQTDSLTGLRNRRFLFASMDRALSETRGHCALLLLDLDRFKDINDRHGHAIGDVVLREFADAIKGCVEPDDYVVRWGGEEFLILLRGAAVDRAMSAGEHVRRTIEARTFAQGHGTPLRLTCSIGFSLYPLLPREPQALPWSVSLELADLALYQVKTQGRNGVAGLVAGSHGTARDLMLGASAKVAEFTQRGVLRWIGMQPRLAPTAEA